MRETGSTASHLWFRSRLQTTYGAYCTSYSCVQNSMGHRELHTDIPLLNIFFPWDRAQRAHLVQGSHDPWHSRYVLQIRVTRAPRWPKWTKAGSSGGHSFPRRPFCLHAVTGLRAETEGRRVIGFHLPPAINSIPRGRHAFPSALWDGHAGARQAGQTTGSAARSTPERSALKTSYPEERLRSVERLSTTPFTDCRLPFPGSNWHRYCANNQLVWDEWEQLILNG